MLRWWHLWRLVHTPPGRRDDPDLVEARARVLAIQRSVHRMDVMLQVKKRRERL